MAIAVDSAPRDGNKGVFNRRIGAAAHKPNKVCYFWRSGSCNRNPCPFLHRELPPPPSINGNASKRPQVGSANNRNFTRPSSLSRRPDPNLRLVSNTWVRNQGDGSATVPRKTQDKNHGDGLAIVPRKTTKDKICHYWLAGNCSYGDECKYLHSWFLCDCFTLLKQLEGHQKVITGVALPSGSDKLYSGSEDQSVRVWDCHTGQCAAVINLDGEIGCMMSEGPWLFIGIPNAVKVWNTQTASEVNLSGPVGQVYSLAEGNEILFAGTQDGKILAWKIDAKNNCFLPTASLEGHRLAVVSLVVGAGRLYSGSMDHTIRAWDLKTLQCIHTLTGHTSVVTSVLCWDEYLLSCSLDKTIKAWAATESGNLEVIHTHNEENGVLTLCGVNDAQAKPVLMCSCNDNTIRIYDLPSFSERGRIFSREEVRAIQIAPGGLGGPGLFFTGDGTGELRVWKWVIEPPNPPQ
ncbi:zinc finger CCCH domain-containing protein 48-like [Telopea speciosissima]|uniref:zinc finger CCCH domain-containing protein 48-like n=1 Tax=Telopea speciosissima TaxID=54955 RepID=UPI001CC48256|nr:zinc finger CCCH domain-containing protein 48-like [Telopea speciosissima]